MSIAHIETSQGSLRVVLTPWEMSLVGAVPLHG
jgi:hypothetical protein